MAFLSPEKTIYTGAVTNHVNILYHKDMPVSISMSEGSAKSRRCAPTAEPFGWANSSMHGLLAMGSGSMSAMTHQ